MFDTKLRRAEDICLTQLLQQELLEYSMKELNDIQADARAQIERIQAENTQQYNLRRKKAQTYSDGELVAISRTQFAQGSKLLPRFIGPHRITKKTGSAWLQKLVNN